MTKTLASIKDILDKTGRELYRESDYQFVEYDVENGILELHFEFAYDVPELSGLQKELTEITREFNAESDEGDEK